MLYFLISLQLKCLKIVLWSHTFLKYNTFLLIADVRTDACLPGEVQGGAGGGEEEVGGGGGQAEQQEGEPQGLRGGETGASTGKPFLNKLCHVNQSRFAQSTL